MNRKIGKRGFRIIMAVLLPLLAIMLFVLILLVIPKFQEKGRFDSEASVETEKIFSHIKLEYAAKNVLVLDNTVLSELGIKFTSQEFGDMAYTVTLNDVEEYLVKQGESYRAYKWMRCTVKVQSKIRTYQRSEVMEHRMK